MVKFSNYGPGSKSMYEGAGLLAGFGFLYLYSRRGAHHLLDFSTLRTCYASSLSAFLVGTCFGSIYRLGTVVEEGKGKEMIQLNRRVA